MHPTERQILIIDDSPEDRESYVRHLGKVPQTTYSCAECENGEEAILLLADNNYEAILLDYSLPGRDGLHVLQAIKTVYPYMPIIMLTGQGNEAVAVNAMHEGAQNYLVKASIGADILHRTIEDAIKNMILQKNITEKNHEIFQQKLELKKNVEEQECLIDKLTKTNTELERFAYVASHDMQEPLRMISNFSDILLSRYQDKLDEEGQQYLNILHQSAKRMQGMVDQLLEYSRLGYEEIRQEKINGNEELSIALFNLKNAIEENKASITSDTLPSFFANKIQFVQLLQNLIGNAIKYKSPVRDPIIHIGVENKEDHYLFYVRDNGIGIAKDYLTEIFAPFRRLHKWSDINGSGIGLSVCKRIVQLHGGKIWAESNPDQGSVFYFTIPKKTSKQMEGKT